LRRAPIAQTASGAFIAFDAAGNAVGVRGGSPRFKSAREELPELNRIYIEERNAKLALQRKGAEIDLALREGTLIPRRRAKVQLGFLLTGLRQRLMSFCYALPPRLVNKSEHEIGQLIDSEMRLALKDVANWPAKMADPAWRPEADADLMPAEENGEAGITPKALAGLAGAEQKATTAQREIVNQRRRRKEKR
jgi:hypothetical protein